MENNLRITKIGRTGKDSQHRPTIRLMVNGFFDNNDTLTIIDLQTCKKTTNVIVKKYRNGNNPSYYINNGAIFQDHIGDYIILQRLSVIDYTKIYTQITDYSCCAIPKYLITSGLDKNPVLAIVINQFALSMLRMEPKLVVM